MSETPKKLNLDDALRQWPDVEKSPVELDESAQAIVARIQAGDRGTTAAALSDENLLAAPLGQSAEDGHNSAALASDANEQREVSKMTMADRERDRRSLQDLAKMAATGLTPPPPSARSSAPSGVQPAAGAAKGEDSGLIDLRAVNSEPAPSVAPAPTSSVPQHGTGLASQGLFSDDSHEEPASMKQPVPSMPPASMPPQSMPYAQQTPSAPPASVAPSMAPVAHAHASIAPAHASSSQRAVQQKKGNGAVIALVFGGVVALSAAAAGTFFFLKMKKPAEAPVATSTQPAVDVKPATPAPTQAAAPAEPTPATEPTMDPNALPTATPDSKLATAPKGHVAGKPGHAAAPAAAPEAPKPEAKLTQKDLPAAPTGPAGDLGKAMGQAVGDDGKPKTAEMTQAAGSNVPAGSVPQKPSQGAVTGAIGAVLRGARDCLGPDDPVSHATVVFGSDGKVQSVSVSGAAAGKPAEACIKTELGKAKVGPFAEPSYSTRITVRHN